jgi:predicted nuclease of predicted toxin-antitoxin system
MKVKLDENLGRRGVEAFRAARHEVDTVVDEGLASATDDEVRAAATGVRRVLVTLDLDFANPFRHPPGPTAGIAVLRLAEPLTAAAIGAAVSVLLAELEHQAITGKLWIVELDRIRIYEPES